LEAKSYQERIQDREVLFILVEEKVKSMLLESSETNNWREVVNG
jgi:hypothetical protein